ncbi:tetratricopeptide repeat protein [Kribbella sp. CA-245084]|uniref:tetratricopeptide repeat protein n=1 Tax=Kribbella sp. CA-245084 TaxID=3239940 RepID=UPI003D8FC0B4
MQAAGREFDFFVSYTQSDRDWAEWIAWTLEDAGHQVLIQAWDFVPGSNWLAYMQQGASRADRIIAVLSDAYLHSEFGEAEWLAAWGQDAQGTVRKLVPVRVADCDRPGLLNGVVSTDLFGLNEVKAQRRLLDAVGKAISGRAKPASKPGFPSQDRARIPPGRVPDALPTVWKVPSRTPTFIGRQEELDRLASEVAAESRVVVQSIRGLGGVGKTQLAIEFAHRQAGQYELVWWIDAEKEATIPGQFARLAEELGLEPNTDPEKLRALVHRALQGLAGWLLIFDNADRVEAVQPWLPTIPLSTGTPGHVIVTTRRSGFGALGEVLEVDVLDMDAAVALLSARVSNLDQRLAAQIAEALGRLPLALEQAAAFLVRSQMPAGEYLTLLDPSTTIATVWTLSFERILNESAAAMQLMDICAYLAPEAIPLDLFTGHTDLLPGPLSDDAQDRLAFGEVIAVLVDYSLVKRTGNNLQIHRLVQATLRSRHRAGIIADSTSRPQTPSAVDQGVPRPNPWMDALQLLHRDTPTTIIGAPENWPRWEQLLPHVLAATGYAEDLAASAGAQATMHTAWLLARAAIYLQVHARPSDAQPLAERALQLVEQTRGPADPDVGKILSLLATILRDLGDVAGAEPLMRRALTIAEATYDSEHIDVATRLGLLARILRDLGDANAAKPLMERALRITEAIHEPNHHAVATRLSSLAGVLRDLGEAEAAKPLMERSLQINMGNFGAEHATVASDRNNLALILRDLGKAAEAKPLMEQALRIKELTYGPDHPDVASGLSSLSQILQDLGETETARELMVRALRIRQETYGPEHPEVASSLSKLASILQDLGRQHEATELMKRALEIHERTYGPDHPTVTTLRNSLAGLADKEDEDG